MICANLILTAGTATLFAVAGVSDTVVSDWDKIGLVGFLALGIVALYRDSIIRQARFEKVLEDAVKVMTEVKDAISKCKGGNDE